MALNCRSLRGGSRQGAPPWMPATKHLCEASWAVVRTEIRPEPRLRDGRLVRPVLSMQADTVPHSDASSSRKTLSTPSPPWV